MFVEINNKNYPAALDRFSEIWDRIDLDHELMGEFELLAALLSAYEEVRFPAVNSYTYIDILNDKCKK